MGIQKVDFRITGMHCPACENLLSDVLSEQTHVTEVRISRKHKSLHAEFAHPVSESEIKQTWNQLLEPMGYRVHLAQEPMKGDSVTGIAWGLGFLVVFAVLQILGVVNLFSPEKMDVAGSFLLGLMASVSSCFAITGGLLMTLTASVGQRHPESLPAVLVAFHSARLVAFLVLGGLLGRLGQALALTPAVFTLLFGVAALVMVALGLNLLGLGIRLPFKTKVTRSDFAKRLASLGSVGGALVLGAATFFLPCGFTQAIQVQALAAGSFLDGGILTLAFAAGTLPVLGLVSFALTAGLSGKLRTRLLKASGVVVLGLGLFQVQSVLVLLGWIQPLSFF